MAGPPPAGTPEWLGPIVSIVPGQLHALHLTRARGLDPRTPAQPQQGHAHDLAAVAGPTRPRRGGWMIAGSRRPGGDRMEDRPTGRKSKSPPRGGAVDRFPARRDPRGFALYLEVPGRRRTASSTALRSSPTKSMSAGTCSRPTASRSGSRTFGRPVAARSSGAAAPRSSWPSRSTKRNATGSSPGSVSEPIVVRREFDQLPDRADHPAFRIVPADRYGPTAASR